VTTFDRLRGLRALLEDAVAHGTSAVERVHKATAARPFAVLDEIPPLALPARGVRVVHDATVSVVYGSIRQVNRLVGAGLALAIDVAEGAAVTDALGEGTEQRARARDSNGDERSPRSGEPSFPGGTPSR
jgi:hypothetical protein